MESRSILAQNSESVAICLIRLSQVFGAPKEGDGQPLTAKELVGYFLPEYKH